MITYKADFGLDSGSRESDNSIVAVYMMPLRLYW